MGNCLLLLFLLGLGAVAAAPCPRTRPEADSFCRLKFRHPNKACMYDEFCCPGRSACFNTTSMICGKVKGEWKWIMNAALRPLCPTLPTRPICRAYRCMAPPAGCGYQLNYDKNGCQLGCGTLHCTGACLPIDCAAPPEGCRYVNATTNPRTGCPDGCGTLDCSVQVNCMLPLCELLAPSCRYINATVDHNGCYADCGTPSCDDSSTTTTTKPIAGTTKPPVIPCGRGQPACPRNSRCVIAPNDSYSYCKQHIPCGRGQPACPLNYRCIIAPDDSYSYCRRKPKKKTTTVVPGND